MVDGANVYRFAQSNPINLYDDNGFFSKGTSATSIRHFVEAIRKWVPEALPNRFVWEDKAVSVREEPGHALIRIFDQDFRAPAENQIVKEVKGEPFSYRNTFLQKRANEKKPPKYIDAGLPLDVEHFFRMAALAQDWPNSFVRLAYIHQEFEQTDDPRPAGRTSAFAPEDLFSNELGVIFGTTVGRTDDPMGFAKELEVFLKEIKTLFTTDNLKDGKYLTGERIQDLRSIAKQYYGTDDLREFQKSGKIFGLKEIKTINDNAAVGNYPFYNNPISAAQYKAKK
jgi:hypothetical protein